ncbi:hypothetical protein MKW98_001456 [Papaver atlanticum]|uniref:Pentatricopeptide repeat-containing protein n=1 Tax=Papaver atlanticum TaxID=357466 RepID=A0AAD4SVG1_9MAGN|nr:hypothetical protein MKW98_001456 [Papaver atlanticum]
MSATTLGLASSSKLKFNFPVTSSSYSFPHNQFLSPRFNFSIETAEKSVKSTLNKKNQSPCLVSSKRSKIWGFRLSGYLELDRGGLVTTDDDDEKDEMSEGFFEAIEEMERMVREPSDVLQEMNTRLTSRELKLVLVYFSQEGRDSWCALEVFEWLQKENRVDKETMELMVSIMCGWVKKLITDDNHVVSDVVDLLMEMDCAGLKPCFSMIEKVISLYWEVEKREMGVMFVKEVLKKGIEYTVEDNESGKGGPIGYLAWKMMIDEDYSGAIKLVIDFRECGLKPEPYSYLIAMSAVVKELNEFSKALRKLKGYTKANLVAELDIENVRLIEKYQSDLVEVGVKLSNWVSDEGSTAQSDLVHERLLAMYICAGQGIEAERQLWEMKLVGKQPGRELYDVVLAICASQKEANAVTRLLSGTEFSSSISKKKTLSWLLRGYVKGGHFEDAYETLVKMLDMGLCPEYLDRAAVLQGLRKGIQQTGNYESYLKLLKRLFEENLTGPALVYMHIDRYNLWIIKML